MCFGYLFANAMYQMGYKKESRSVADKAMKWSYQDNNNQLNKLSWFLCTKLKIVNPVHIDKELLNFSVKNY